MTQPANPPPYSGPYSGPNTGPYSGPNTGPYMGPEPGITVIHVQPAPAHYITTPVLVGQPVGSEPTLIVCQSCRHQIVTNIEVRPSVRTHLWAICLLLIGCWPCMCIPYCTPECMNVDHYCPHCNAFVGKYHN